MMKSLIENILMETHKMNKQKILYFPDFRHGMTKEPEVMDVLKAALTNYEINSIDLTSCLEKYECAASKIDKVLQSEQPDIILADGLGGFFVHALSGYNRICVNPILSAKLYINDSYRSAEAQQFSYNRVPDRENNTYCWGVFGKHGYKKDFAMLHYPNVINIDQRTFSVCEVMDIVIPLIQTITKSEYTDDDSVLYTNYGRTLVKADYALFRDVENYEVPNGVMTIRECAFSGMNLKSITFPDSLCFIGKHAFSDCRNLESVIIPKSVDLIREGCFDGCLSLKDVQLPKSLFSIHPHAFTRTSLREIELPDSIQGIAPNAFDNGVKLIVSSSRLTELLQDSMHYQTNQSNDIIGCEI